MPRTCRIGSRLPLVAAVAWLWVASGTGQVITGDVTRAKVVLGSVQDLSVLRAVLTHTSVSSCLAAALAAGMPCSEVSFQPVAHGQRNLTVYALRARLGTNQRLEVIYLHNGLPSLHGDRLFIVMQAAAPQPATAIFLGTPGDLAFLQEVLTCSDPRVGQAMLTTATLGVSAWSLTAKPIARDLTRHLLTITPAVPASAQRSIRVQCDYDAASGAWGTIHVLP